MGKAEENPTVRRTGTDASQVGGLRGFKYHSSFLKTGPYSPIRKGCRVLERHTRTTAKREIDSVPAWESFGPPALYLQTTKGHFRQEFSFQMG
jgi:hypothetical protein